MGAIEMQLQLLAFRQILPAVTDWQFRQGGGNPHTWGKVGAIAKLLLLFNEKCELKRKDCVQLWPFQHKF